MRNVAKLFVILALAFIGEAIRAPAVFAQQPEEDVVYLKDGSIIRGTIVEQKPGESLSIRTKDGSVFRYNMSLITKLAKEPVVSTKSSGNAAALGWKDPGTATLISVLVAGGGQFYSGETNRGLMIMGVGLGALVIGAAATSCDLYSCSSTPLVLGSLVYLGSWVYGIMDADESARRMNAKRGLGALDSKLLPVGYADGEGMVIGLRIRTP